MPDVSVRQQIRAWWRDEIDGKEAVDLKVLSEKAATSLQQDPSFCERFFAELLQPLVYDVGLVMLSRDRRNVSGGIHRMSGRQIAEAIESESDDWSRWLEHDPESGKHISLFAMTKEQALAAAKAREERADPDLRRAGLLRLAAGRLEKGQRIDEVWTASGLADIEARLEISRPKYSLGQGTIYELMQRKAS